MKTRNLQNKNLDRLGRKMLDAAKFGNDEIEKIVSSPKLFDAVKAGIENERRVRESKNVSRSVWSDFHFSNWQQIKVFAAVLLFLTGGAIGIGFINFKEITIEQTAVLPVETPAKHFEIPLIAPVKVSPETPQTAANQNKRNKSYQFVTQAVSVNKTRKTEKSFAKIESKRKSVNKQKPSRLEFYALNGNPVEPGEEMRIVRTELSRTALFALGVNLPIENETEKLKTDLLVGSDGVAKAFRIVD